jgi:hypothetical protein
MRASSCSSTLRVCRGRSICSPVVAEGLSPDKVVGAAVNAVAASGGLAVTAAVQARARVARSSVSELRWAVLEKLFEIHGGSVREESGAPGR